MPTFNGRFYFKRSANGNLVGEFSNDVALGIYTESADANTFTTNFIGQYHSTWQENGRPLFATLTISYKPHTGGRIYTLRWERGSTLIFSGEGMLCENVLIGNYLNHP